MSHFLQNILHVDDDAVLRDITRTALIKSGYGYAVTSCASAQEALEKIKTLTPDLLLIDYQMPHMNGVDLAHKLRSLPNGKKPPIIFVTGKTDFSTESYTALSNVIGILVKPFSTKNLAETLRTMWERRSLY
jgi:two-component system, OmpR family, response regulator